MNSVSAESCQAGLGSESPERLVYCDQTLGRPEEDLAYDEVLLDLAETGHCGPTLRFWEPKSYFVVLGYSNKAAIEVNLNRCADKNIPVFRRCSGGGTVLQGPGCLNYSLVLPIKASSPLAGIHTANLFIMEKNARAVTKALQQQAERRGDTDLAIDGRKICGNAQRRRKRFLVFHGCFLLGLDLEFLAEVLPMPSKQPDYRQNRSHSDFIVNLGVEASILKSALAEEWNATRPAEEVPKDMIGRLAREKYLSRDWNLKF